MNERLICIPVSAKPTNGAALGANFAYFYVPIQMTIVYVSAAPSTDDADGTIDINDDGSGVITAVGCADADVPGTWISTHMGGTEDPVLVAADSKMSLDGNNLANNTGVVVHIYALVGEGV